MYCVFPFCLRRLVLESNDEGPGLVGGVTSAALWLAAQWGYGRRFPPGALDQPGNIQLCLAWQAYFVAGQYLGYRSLNAGEDAVPKSPVLLGVCVVASLLFFLDRHSQFIFGVTPAAEILHWPQPDSSEIPGRGLPGL